MVLSNFKIVGKAAWYNYNSPHTTIVLDFNYIIGSFRNPPANIIISYALSKTNEIAIQATSTTSITAITSSSPPTLQVRIDLTDAPGYTLGDHVFITIIGTLDGSSDNDSINILLN
jgi:hypothetical protein